ncbi:MAG: MFS transporter, partial [Methanobacteriota archaeon]
GLDLATLGIIFFAAQVVTAFSFLVSERIARRIGLLRTMVFTHIPSNLLLIAVALAPTPLLAVSFLLCRQSLSQMDVPARQSYIMAIVSETDRTAAAGFTNTTRTIASSVGPALAGYALANFWIGTPLALAGSLKLAYDFLIYKVFRNVRPPEENAPHGR